MNLYDKSDSSFRLPENSRRHLGMDEAGYGPNFGPLAIVATDWTIPEEESFDFWTALTDIVVNETPNNDQRIHVGDSKAVYSPSKGIASLERSVLAIAKIAEIDTTTYRSFLYDVAGIDDNFLDEIPWYCDVDLVLPKSAKANQVEVDSSSLMESMQNAGVSLNAVRADLVFPERFNSDLENGLNKAELLSRASLDLFRSAWQHPENWESISTILFADKHGGRNRYADLIVECFDGQLPIPVGESKNVSAYRLGKTELKFLTKAERFFPTAVASMFAKYLRELSMELFNQFWKKQLPSLKPTKGYPLDARRFMAEIQDTFTLLEIPRKQLWREK